jgi:hypothetical protein
VEFLHLIILFRTINESNQTVRTINESNFKLWFEFETAYLFRIKLVQNRFQIKLEHTLVRSCSIRLQPYTEVGIIYKSSVFKIGLSASLKKLIFM